MFRRLFPGSRTIAGFWRDILAGRDLITDVPATHWLVEDYLDPDPTAPDKIYTARGAFLPPIDFDPVEFGIPPALFPRPTPPSCWRCSSPRTCSTTSPVTTSPG